MELAIDNLVKLYFDYSPPFENNAKKKNEFPDAIALLSLEQYAKDNNLNILTVSNDKGWMNFAQSSDQIDVEPDLTKALALLQTHANEAKKLVATFLKDLDQGNLDEEFNLINDTIDQSVSASEPIAEADSYLRNEAECNAEVSFNDFSFLDTTTFSIVQIGKNSIVAEIPVNIYANAFANFSFYVYDSIDKDEIYMGSQSVEEEIEFKAAILITLEINSSTTPETVELTDIEMIKVIDSVDFGEIEPYSEPEYEE